MPKTNEKDYINQVTDPRINSERLTPESPPDVCHDDTSISEPGFWINEAG